MPNVATPKRADRGPEDRSFAEMEASLERAGRVEELIRLYEARSREVEPEEAAQLLARAGGLARDRLKNLSRAEDLFRRALLRHGRGKDALNGLRALYENKHDATGLVDVLERLAAANEGAEAAALYLRAADLYEQKLNRRDRAVLACQKASRVAPTERAAFRRARALFLAEGRAQPAFDSLEREREAVGADGLEPEYIAFAERLVEDPAMHGLALRALDRAAETQGADGKVAAVRAAIQQLPEVWRDRVRALRAASLEERDRKTAARHSLVVAKLFAWYEPQAAAKVKEALERCFMLWPAMPEAVSLIEQVAERQGDYASAIAQLEKMAAESKDRAAQVELWLRVGMLRLAKLNDATGALTAFELAARTDPSRPDATTLTAEMLIDDGRPEQAIELLERHLATPMDRAAQVALLLRLADLYLASAKNAEAALGHLKAALKLEPTHAQAAFRAVRLLADEDAREELWPLLELAVSAERPTSERVALCEAVAMLCEEAGEHRRAFEALALALQVEPGRPRLLGAVVEAAKKAGAEPALVVTLRRVARAVSGPVSVDLWRQLAEVLQAPLGRIAEAEAAWREVLALNPDDEAAKAAVAQLARSANAPPDPRALLEAEARRLEAAGAAPDALVQVYRRLLDLDPEHVETLKKLAAAYGSIGRWDEVAKVYPRIIVSLEDVSERPEWRSRMAQLYAERLNRAEDAAKLYLELLSEGIATAAVIGGLERLAAQGVRQKDISQALAPHYAHSGDYQRQVASLLVQLSTVQAKEEQKALLALLADTTEKRLMDTRGALEFRIRGLGVDPADAEFRKEAVRLARDLKAHAELARHLVDASSKLPDGELATGLLEEAALLAEEGGSVDEAAGALNAALARKPEHAGILTQLVELYSKAGRFTECDQALRRRIAISRPEERAALHLRLADVDAELGRARDAAQAVQDAIAAGANEAEQLPRLCQLLEQGNRMGELSNALGRWIEVAEQQGDAELVSRLSLRRAKVLDASLGDHAEAVRRYSEVLATRPSDPDALVALEHLLTDPTCREEAARALVPAYESVKDHRKLVLALGVIAEAAHDALEKVLALKQVAYVHTHHLRQRDQAFAALATALRYAPGDASVRGAARQAAEDADALDSYAEVLSELVENVEGAVAVDLHRELAEVYEKKLDARDSAVVHLRRVLALEPKSAEALKSLARLHRAHDEWAALAEVLEQLATVELEPATKMALWREVALLHEQRLGDKESAAAAWRQIAARDVLDREAATALDRLCTELDKPDELAFALELRRNQEGQSPQGRELAFRLAQLRQLRLGDSPGALQLYRQILTEDTGHTGARNALEAWARTGASESAAAMEILDPVLAQFGEHMRRIQLREVRQEGASGAERARLQQEIRLIYERDLGQPQAAFLAALKAFGDGVDRDVVRPDLERLARETGSFEDLAEIYEETASELKVGDEGRVPLLRRAAELREQLGQVEDAVRVWKDLLAEAPQDRQALDNLGRLYERTQNAKNLSEVYARKAQLATEPAERLDLLSKAAAAFEAAGDDAKAIDALKSSLVIRKSREALLALDRLFGRTKRYSEQADVLNQLAELASDDEARRNFVTRRAQLLEKEGQPQEAVRAYASVLELAPGDANAVAGAERLLQIDACRIEAARLLEPIYRQQRDLKRLVDVLDVRVAGADPSGRSQLLSEIARLRESLGQKALAFAAWLRAFAESPEDKSTREELERLAADTGAFEELAAAYEDQLERGAAEPLGEELWRRLAVLYGDRLNRPDLAARAWTEVAQRDPRNLFVLDALARIYRKTGAYRELAQVMRRQIALEANASTQVTLLFELARLGEETLGDKGLAAESYQEILQRSPDDPNAIKFLGRVLSETERWAELAQLIAREAQLAEAQGAVEQSFELLVRLGRLKLTRLGDHRGALNQFQDILRRRPGHPGAIGALEEMARSDSPLRGDAASALEPVFATEGEHLKLVQMLESRASAETDVRERAALLRKVAELYSTQMSNPEMAFVAATRALREVPDDERSLELCLFLVDAADAADELSTLLSDVAEKAADDKARAALYRALARLQVEHQEFEEAAETWKRVLEILPNDAEALDAVGRALSKLGRGQDLLEVLRRQLSMTEDPQRRAAILLQIGVLQEEQLNDRAGALTTFRRLVELRPEDPVALERLDGICEKQERWPELADVLSRRVQLADASSAVELKFRLAQLRETRLLDKMGALDLYSEVLEVEPAHAGALTRMEVLVAREPQNQVAVDVLLGAYRANGDALKRAQVLDARVAVAPDASERKALLLELAGLREQQDESELAFLALWRAFREDPNDADLRARLEAAADRSKAYDELAAAYEEELPRIAEAKDAARVCLKLGSMLDSKLSEPERAAAYFEKAQQFDPEVWPTALAALDRIYNQVDQPEALARTLQALADRVEDPREKVGYLFRLGQLWHEVLEEPAKGAEAYERILELDEKHLAAARLLEQLYEEQNDADKLYGVLKRQRELVSGPERERVLGKMAAVSAEGLSDVSHSIDLYREVLAKNPRNEQAFAALEGLLESGGRNQELRELLESRLAHTVEPRELVRLNERIGRVVFELLKQPEEAVPYFKAALERDARHRGALDALRDIHEALDQKEELVVVLRRLIPLQEGADGVKALRIRLAELLAAVGRREEALDAARRALEIEPHRAEEMNRVAAVFLELKAYSDAARALELRAQTELLLEDVQAAVNTYFEISDLWRDTAGKPESSGAPLEKVLEVDPANRDAYERAIDLYQSLNDWRQYAVVVDRYLPHLVTEEEKIDALREVARVQETKLGQAHVAFLQMCRALQLNPSDHTLSEEVERLAEDTGSYEELAAVYEEIADSVPRGPLAERLYLVLARVQDERLDDPDAAEVSLRKILEFDPTNEVALEALSRVFERRGKDQEYIVALEQKLEAAGSIEKRKEILREIGRVYHERMNNPREAAQALVRALDLEPDFQTLEVLAGLYRSQQDYRNLASTLLRARDLAGTPQEQAHFQVEIAQLYERELEDDARAIQEYRQALEFDPAHRAALDALERLYTKLDKPAELLAVYERQIELSEDWNEKVKGLFKSASIWEDRYQNLPNADSCIEGVLALDPHNLQAIKTLERLRRAQGRFEDLVGVMERHLQLLTVAAEQAELCVEMGDIFYQQLKQADRAVSLYDRALELNSRCRPAMHALGKLYERSGNWPFALDMLQREARVVGSSPEALDLLHRMGRINEDMLIDPASAKACYLEALRIDPGYLPALQSLKGILEIEKDWDSYEKVLVQEAQQTEDPVEKAAAMVQVARYHLEHKEDRDTATRWFEEALRLVPDLLDAAKPLADAYIAREEWEPGERMLDIVVRKMAEQALAQQDGELAKELCRQLYRLGYVAEKLGNREKALKSYEKAYQLDATYLPVLEGLGNLLVHAQRFEEALKVYQTILIHHRDDLTDLEVVEIYWQLGEVHTALKQYDRAQNHYDKALAIDPGHEPSLRSLVQLADNAGRWDKAAEYRQSLMRVLEGDEKFDVCVELGGIAHQKLNDPYMAIDAYLGAHKLNPDSAEVMDSLYVLYRETRQGPKAVEMLEKMLAHPDLRADAQRAKRVQFALGEISRDELQDTDRAVAAFNAALDLDYRFVEAFSAIEALLGQQKKWKLLEENYAAMVQRLPKTDETHAARMTLWKALGDLYLKVLKHPEGALMAYQVVAAGLPDDPVVQEAYAELAAQQPGQEEQAVAAYRRALPQTSNPGKVASALAELAARRKDYDSAYLAAQVVSGLIGEPGPGEREILAKLGPYAKKREVAQRALTDRLWHSHLFHPKVRGPMAEMMAILFEQAGHLYKEDFNRYQLNPKKHQVDVASAQEYQIHHFRYVARLLGMEQVALFSPFLISTRERMAKRSSDPAPDPMLGIEICQTVPVALKVGGKFFSETGQKETYYALGRTLALLRPELAMAQRVPAQRLEVIFQAALALGADAFRPTVDLKALETERRALERALPEAARAALARVSHEYLRVAGPNDLRNYLEGTELSAVRAGLFVTGDIEPVKKMVLGETGATYRVQPRSKIRDLMVFALSEDLHALRAAVGTSVEVQVRR